MTFKAPERGWNVPVIALASVTVAVILLFAFDWFVVRDSRTSAVAATGQTSVFQPKVTPVLTPKAELEPVPDGEVNVAYAPNVPPRADRTDQRIVEVSFEVVEGISAIDPATGVEFDVWGYKVAGDPEVRSGSPGPMIRARVGDLFRFTLTNPSTNTHPHNVDFHAVTGQGGGAADTTVAPGETKTIEGRLLYPGVFMYHCAFGDVPLHIAHGMHGGILVDPVEPLPAADHEFYVVQSEYYTVGTEPGVVEMDRQALTDEHPTMVVFNGAKGSLTGDNSLRINVGERARIYFVNSGLNLDSNFHPIGSHWDAVWQEAALLSPPIRGSQTTLVPAGGGVVADLVGMVPSKILLVDHALVRTFDKGALGIIEVSGDPNPEIFEPMGSEGGAATTTTTAGGSGIDAAAVYAENCAACHGNDLKGGVGPDLTSGRAVEHDDAELTRIIIGGEDGGMPAWGGRLSTGEIEALVAFIRQAQP